MALDTQGSLLAEDQSGSSPMLFSRFLRGVGPVQVWLSLGGMRCRNADGIHSYWLTTVTQKEDALPLYVRKKTGDVFEVFAYVAEKVFYLTCHSYHYNGTVDCEGVQDAYYVHLHDHPDEAVWHVQFFPDDSVIFRSGHRLSHGLALSLPVIPKNPFLNLDDCAVAFEQAPYCQEVSTTHPMALHFCHSLWSCQLADRQGRCHFFLSCVIVYCFTLSALLQLECRLLVCAVEHLSAVVSMEH